MIRSEADPLKKVVVCSPVREYFQVNDLEAHNIGAGADRETALLQHEALKMILMSFGAEVVDVPELEGHPNSVFTRDASLVTPGGYIRLRMGLKTRREEDDWMAGHLDRLGLDCAGTIEEPGTVEGGDVILAGPTAFVGLSARTNSHGIRQLRGFLKRMGFDVRVMDVPAPHLHIGGLMSLVGPEDIVCCEGLFPDDCFRGFRTIPIGCDSAVTANVVCLGRGELLADSGNRSAVRALRESGFRVHVLNLSEFVKGRGGPTCLILPAARA